MKKAIIYTAITTLILSGCKSTQVIDENASADLQSKLHSISYDRVLDWDGKEFSLKSVLVPKSKNDTSSMFDETSWVLDGKTLFPSFKSDRFECSIGYTCASFEQNTSPFLKVSTSKSSSGETYIQRVESGKDPGLTGKDVLSYAVGGGLMVLFWPAVLATYAIAKLAPNQKEPENKYVEFDHDEFFKQSVKVIEEEYGSLSNYILYMSHASETYNSLANLNEANFYKLKQYRDNKAAEVSKFDDIDVVNVEMLELNMVAEEDLDKVFALKKDEVLAYYKNAQNEVLVDFESKIKLAKANFIAQQKTEYAKAKSFDQLELFIKKYEHRDLAGLMTTAQKKWNRLFIDEQKIAFNNIQTSQECESFISKYKYKDHAGLLSEAEEKLSKLIITEQKLAFKKITTISEGEAFIKKYRFKDKANLTSKVREMIDNAKSEAQRQKEENRRQQYAKLVEWRNNLKVGDHTFCGRVIQANAPMFNIALDNPLSGYSETKWLHKDDIYHSDSGCRNVNNQLSPYSL